MAWFKRKPLITDDIYGKLMMSFGRVVDRDPFVRGPAEALAQQVVELHQAQVAAVDARTYQGAAVYHLRLLAGAWIMSAEGTVPVKTAEVFEEAVAWHFEPLAKGSGQLSHVLSRLARGESARKE